LPELYSKQAELKEEEESPLKYFDQADKENVNILNESIKEFFLIINLLI